MATTDRADFGAPIFATGHPIALATGFPGGWHFSNARYDDVAVTAGVNSAAAPGLVAGCMHGVLFSPEIFSIAFFESRVVAFNANNSPFAIGDLVRVDANRVLVSFWVDDASHGSSGAILRLFSADGSDTDLGGAFMAGPGSSVPAARYQVGPFAVTDPAGTVYALAWDIPNNVLKLGKATAFNGAWAWKTVAAGKTFVRGGLWKSGSTITALAFDPGAKSITPYTSTDDGTTWTPGTVLPDAGNVEFASAQFKDASNGAVAYCDRTSDFGVHVLLTPDGGASWRSVKVASSHPLGDKSIGVFVATRTHLIVQWILNLSGAGPQWSESTDAGYTWSSPVTVPPLSNDDFYDLNSRLTRGPSASSGFDGGPLVADDPSQRFPVSAAVGVAAPSPGFPDGFARGFVCQLLGTERGTDPDGFAGAFPRGGSSQTEIARVMGGFFQGGPTWTEIASIRPIGGGGPSVSELADVQPGQAQHGFAVIVGTAPQDQLGSATILIQTAKAQSGFAVVSVPASLEIAPRVSRLDDGGWLFEWDDSGGPYEVWLHGRRLATQAATTYFVRQAGFDFAPPDLEIVGSS